MMTLIRSLPVSLVSVLIFFNGFEPSGVSHLARFATSKCPDISIINQKHGALYHGCGHNRGVRRQTNGLCNHPYRVPTLSVLREGNTFHCVIGKRWNGSAESRNLSMRRNLNREDREIPEIFQRPSGCWERSENAYGGTADMYVFGKSDDFVVPTKWANKAGTPVAESMEGSRSPKSTYTACRDARIATVMA